MEFKKTQREKGIKIHNESLRRGTKWHLGASRYRYMLRMGQSSTLVIGAQDGFAAATDDDDGDDAATTDTAAADDDDAASPAAAAAVHELTARMPLIQRSSMPLILLLHLLQKSAFVLRAATRLRAML